MDYERLGSKLASIFRQHWLTITIGVAGLIYLGYVLIYLMDSNSNDQGIVFEAGESSPEPVKKIWLM